MSLQLFNKPSFKKFLSEIEGQNFERKSVLIQSRALAAELSSFANSSVEGGLVVVGISKDKDVVGINFVGQGKINKLLQAAKDHCPYLVVKHKFFGIINNKKKEDQLLLFYVYYSPNKVMRLNSGKAFERLGDRTCLMLPPKIELMQHEKKQSDFEKELIPSLGIKQLNKGLIEEFIKNWVKRDALTSKPSLEQLIVVKGFGKKDRSVLKINNAGALLFYNRPEEFFPGARIRFFRYEGTEIKTGSDSNMIKDKIFTGPVTKQIDEALEMVKPQLREFSFLGKDGKFKTVLEYPEFAFLEAIVNAVVHRAYFIKNSNIFITMFDDRIEVQSPGNLPGIVNIKNIYQESFPRNPLLMNGLLYLNYVKQASEGLDRMRKEMINYGLPGPEFEDNKEAIQFKVILRNDIKKRTKKDQLAELKDLKQEIIESLNEDQKKIIYFLLTNKEGGTKDFMKEIGKERTTVIRLRRKLEEKSIIKKTLPKGPNIKYRLTKVIFREDAKDQPLIKDKEIDSTRQSPLF